MSLRSQAARDEVIGVEHKMRGCGDTCIDDAEDVIRISVAREVIAVKVDRE